MNVPRFEVYPYSIGELERLLADKSSNSVELIAAKIHRNYFDGYFSSLHTSAILVENDYIDRDYLEDFAAYYVRCFEPYRRFCTRLHFFDIPFSSDDINSLLSEVSTTLNEDLLQEHYLGFIVVKPLPQTIIGRTCLKTYPSEGRRNFPIIRQYHANVFGIDLHVHSLAFQEQDQVVAACATSAIWCVLHGTGMRFQHPIPSPVEITKAATEKLALETRALPNRGLPISGIAHAIRSIGLEPTPENVSNEHLLRITLYAYLRAHLPVILVIELFDTSVDPHESMGLHAVAVTGYSLGLQSAVSYGETGILLKSSRIDRIYVHDDQVGPFARMIFDNVAISIKENGEIMNVNSLSTSWTNNGRSGTVRACPKHALIPLYHKIRIQLDAILEAITTFDNLLEAIRTKIEATYEQRLEWEIFLTTVNEVKTELRSANVLSGVYLRNCLVDCMPRFIWRATATSAKIPVLDLLFDATDIEQGRFFVRAIEYNKELGMLLRAVAKGPVLHDITRCDWKIIHWFSNAPPSI